MFEAHHRRVLGYALRRVTQEADAEDVVAETFAIAWRRIADAPAPAEALPWLFAVARRVIANQRRGLTRRLHLVSRLKDHLVSRAPSALDSPVLEALARLRPEDQELVRLVAWEGLSHAEAGIVLGISANAVAIRLHRARRRLAQEIGSIRGNEMKGSAPTRTDQRVEGRLSGQRREGEP
ncbi:MAG: RNA polymerase sigma factor [Chloroflexi bacterium]|nr:RNA polymerase sigma factor [Chloroflexota bacterium]